MNFIKHIIDEIEKSMNELSSEHDEKVEKFTRLENEILIQLDNLKDMIKNKSYFGTKYSWSYVDSNYKRNALQLRKNLIKFEKMIKHLEG